MDESIIEYHKDVVDTDAINDVSDTHRDIIEMCVEAAHTRSNPLPISHAGVYKSVETDQYTLIMTIATTDIIKPQHVFVQFTDETTPSTVLRDSIVRFSTVEDMLWKKLVSIQDNDE